MTATFKNRNQWALIIGGSSGLGLATAKKLATEGLNICIIHRDRKSVMTEVENQFEEIRAYRVKLLNFNIDAMRSDKRQDFIASFINEIQTTDRIKTLIYSVARGNLKTMSGPENEVLKNDDFHLTIDAMAVGLYDWVRLIFDADLFSDDARVISFTSEGNQRAWPYYGAVSAAKAALEAISRNIALEFAPYGIKSNCIQAGVTDTASLRMIPGSDELVLNSMKRNPYQRLTTPEDVANVVYLLCRDESSWINGTVIPVDGGESIC